MNAEQKAKTVLDWFLASNNEESALIPEIQGISESRSEASEWYLFPALIFTRYYFDGLNCPETYFYLESDGTLLEKKFDDSAVFKALCNETKSRWKDLTDEQKIQIMYLYPQFHMINDAVANGMEPKDIPIDQVTII